MSDINDGGPAFPSTTPEDGKHFTVLGMTLRDYFAAKAMEAMLSRMNLEIKTDDLLPTFCYALADAMLRARGQS